jgi:hypothetical protein
MLIELSDELVPPLWDTWRHGDIRILPRMLVLLRVENVLITHNSNFTPKLVLDLSCLDCIGAVFVDQLVQVYGNRSEGLQKTNAILYVRLIPILNLVRVS